MSRLPVRMRVTLAFAAAMAVLLGALGAFLWLELRSSLDETIDDNLRSRLVEVSGLVDSSSKLGSGSSFSFEDEDETFAQVLAPSGAVAFSSQVAGDAPLLDPDEIPGPGAEAVERERESLPGIDGGARLLAAQAPPAGGAERPRVVVVGASLDDRDETLSSLAALLLIGGPIALLLASLAGYGAASGALRPVESMRRRAAEISAGDAGERLPVPAARDELRRLGETLNEMLARLEAAIERERRFVDDASHELRTPLALHRAELEVALRYGDDPAELRSSIASAIEEVDRLVALAEALLVVARSGPDGLTLTSEPVRVAELFATVRERFRARAERAGRALSFAGGEDLVVVADRMRLEQALTGLVDNALRHGGGEVRVWAEEGADGVALHVADEGPGFREEFIDRAFERFSRADPARARGGAGLGLAIVDSIAKAHGGSADARNLGSGGADVWIELPSNLAA